MALLKPTYGVYRIIAPTFGVYGGCHFTPLAKQVSQVPINPRALY